MNQKPRKIIARSGAGLRDAMFDVLERLRDGDMVAQDAKEMANVARVILESVSVQMDFEEKKLASEIPAHLSDMQLVPPLNNVLESAGEQHERVE